MSKKNIRQNFFLKVKKTLDEVDKAGEVANHFRVVVLMGDKNEQKAYSYIHAPQADIEKLILHGLRNSETFAYSIAKAMETYCMEEEEKNNQSPTKSDKDENNQN